VSVVHGLASSQLAAQVADGPQIPVLGLHSWSAGHETGVPLVHVPAVHTSPTVHWSASVQPEPSGSGAVQAFAASEHVSAQLPSPSGPGHGVPACKAHVPRTHVSVPLQKMPSVQGAPSAALTSAGQAAALPLQVSATSQSPALGRHACPAARNVQVAVQHDAGVPFAGPASHSSWLSGSTVPLPHWHAGFGGWPHVTLVPSQ
jgi:hypothetical protein